MDMWALGVCIYMWVFGHLPFTGAAPFIIYEKIRSQDIQLPDVDNGGMQVRARPTQHNPLRDAVLLGAASSFAVKSDSCTAAE